MLLCKNLLITLFNFTGSLVRYIIKYGAFFFSKILHNNIITHDFKVHYHIHNITILSY